MRLHARRAIVLTAVAVSLVLGLVSIRVAAHLAALAAAPTAPPVSLATLSNELAAEQARSASLEQQLADLLNATGSLTTALNSTSSQVSLDGLNASQLRSRLAAAQAKLAAVSALLAESEARLAALQGGTPAAGATPPPAGGPTSPTPQPSAPTLTLALVSGGVKATWSSCPASNFASAVLVRSLDPEIHYPPEDLDTVVATVNSLSVTTATDASPPSGTLTYRLYCLTTSGGQTRVGATSPTRQLTVP